MRNTSQAAPQVIEHLLTEYAQSRNPAIRDRILEAHLYIAEIIARKFSGRGVDYDDLYQVAALALFKAIDRFDPYRGIKFVSFVTPTMVGEVKNYFRDKSRTIRMPRRGAQLLREIEKAKEALSQTLHRMPRSDELAQYMDLPEEDILEALETGAAGGVVSMDYAKEGEDEGASLDTFLGEEEKGYASFENADAVSRAMQALDERQRRVIYLRYFENLSQREIAEHLGISQMTVSREERKALEIMRKQV